MTGPGRAPPAPADAALAQTNAEADNQHVSDDDNTSPGPFRYNLELTPAQLKITHTALHSLLDDFGHQQSDVNAVIREVLDKLPDDHAMRTVRLDTELERQLEAADPDPPTPIGGDDGDGPGPSAA
jgi:hypothetical protein